MATPQRNKGDIGSRSAAALTRYQSSQVTPEQVAEGQKIQETDLDIQKKKADIKEKKDVAAAGGLTQKEFFSLDDSEKIAFAQQNPDSPLFRSEYIETLVRQQIESEDENYLTKITSRIDELRSMLTEMQGTGETVYVDYPAYKKDQKPIPQKRKNETDEEYEARVNRAQAKLKQEYRTTAKEEKVLRYPEGSQERIDMQQELYALQVERDTFNGMKKLRTYDEETMSYTYKNPDNGENITEEEYMDAYESWANPAVTAAHKEITNLINKKAAGTISGYSYTQAVRNILSQFTIPDEQGGGNIYIDLSTNYGFIYDEYGRQNFVDMSALKTLARPGE